MLNICIRTLQGHPDPTRPLSQRNALRLLVHFLGDIHQPLHVSCGFIDVNGPNHTILIVRDPAVIKQKHLPSDKGANDLVIDNDRANLHSFWDFTLVTSLMNSIGQEITSDTLGMFLKENVKPRASWKPHGPVGTWAAQWATDSLRQSRDHTYKSVQIVRQRTIPVLSHGQPLIRDGQPVMQTVFDITRAANYETVNRELVRQQLAKGGFRLAKLLDAIYAG
ncbi:MAG: S1/P1 nuclease [bacterium]